MITDLIESANFSAEGVVDSSYIEPNENGFKEKNKVFAWAVANSVDELCLPVKNSSRITV